MEGNPFWCSAGFYPGVTVFICDLFSIMNNANFGSYADDNTQYTFL